jgi:hypothetical protein
MIEKRPFAAWVGNKQPKTGNTSNGFVSTHARFQPSAFGTRAKGNQSPILFMLSAGRFWRVPMGHDWSRFILPVAFNRGIRQPKRQHPCSHHPLPYLPTAINASKPKKVIAFNKLEKNAIGAACVLPMIVVE